SGIALTRDESRFVIRSVPDKPGIAAKVFGSLAEQGVVVDVIVQTPAKEDGRTDMAFTVGRLDAEKTSELVRRRLQRLRRPMHPLCPLSSRSSRRSFRSCRRESRSQKRQGRSLPSPPIA